MADIVSPATRSRMMSGIRGKDTKPELMLRRGLHGRGFRFRLHAHLLPGRPDMVFPRRQAVLFAHGCFWHGHDCPLFRLPGTRTDFWQSKIAANQMRDASAHAALLSGGWRIATVWECALRGRGALPFHDVLDMLAGWLVSPLPEIEIKGQQ
jgi:DNA mismatch endonuclease (patch repair protein)